MNEKLTLSKLKQLVNEALKKCGDMPVHVGIDDQGSPVEWCMSLHAIGVLEWDSGILFGLMVSKECLERTLLHYTSEKKENIC